MQELMTDRMTKPCPTCGDRHPVGPVMIPHGRSAFDAKAYKFFRWIARSKRNESWHAVQDRLRNLLLYGRNTTVSAAPNCTVTVTREPPNTPGFPVCVTIPPESPSALAFERWLRGKYATPSSPESPSPRAGDSTRLGRWRN